MVNQHAKRYQLTVFGKRLKEARQVARIPQDRLGVLIGLDEHTASARMSRYENGIHQPPIQTAMLIAQTLSVPLAYLYCDDDRMARILLKLQALNEREMACLEDWLNEKCSVTANRPM